MKVADLSDAATTLAVELIPAPTKEPPSHAVKRGQAPLLAELFLDRFEDVTDVTTASEKKTVSGKTFDCTRLAFTTHRKLELRVSEDLLYETRWTVWFSADVKASGVVAADKLECVTGGGAADEEWHTTYEVAGYGSGDTALWGKKGDAVDLTPPVVKHRPWKLPLDIFANAKPGDWQTIVQDVISPDEKLMPSQRIVLGVEITKVTPEAVTYKAQTRMKGVDKTNETTVARKDLTLERFANIPEGALRAPSASDDERKVGAKTFKCKKLVYVDRRVATMPAPRKGDEARTIVNTSSVALWLSADMPGRGLVRMEVVTIGSGGPKRVQWKWNLAVAGYGHGAETEWGERASEVSLDIK
jgi:hypothetical protein